MPENNRRPTITKKEPVSDLNLAADKIPPLQVDDIDINLPKVHVHVLSHSSISDFIESEHNNVSF